MNQPTWEDFQRLESEQKQLKEEMRRLREQITEPMKPINVNVASADVVTRLDNLDQKLDRIDQKQDEHAKGLLMHSRNISAFQEEMKGARADILQIRESQADLRDAIGKTATQEGLSQLEARMATKDDVSRIETVLAEILNRLPPKQ